MKDVYKYCLFIILIDPNFYVQIMKSHSTFQQIPSLYSIKIYYHIQMQSEQTQKIIEEYKSTPQLRSKLCRSMQIKVTQVQNPINKDLTFLIQTRTVSQHQLFKQLTRKAKQIDIVEQYLYSEYGGHVIPILERDLFFSQQNQSQNINQNKILQDLTSDVQKYLNNVARDFYCSGDQRVFDLLFNHEFVAQEQNTYEKVLSKAVLYSRKYLNSIFARKELHQFSNPYTNEMLESYKELQEFQIVFKEFSILIWNNQQQIELIDDIFSQMSELCTQAADSITTNPYISSNRKNQLTKLERIFKQSTFSYKRWEMQNQKVRQLEGDANKGMHADIKELKIQSDKLKEWTQSLTRQYQEITQYGKQLLEKIAQQFSSNKQFQYSKNIQLAEILSNARFSLSSSSCHKQLEIQQKLESQQILKQQAGQDNQNIIFQSQQIQLQKMEQKYEQQAETNSQDVYTYTQKQIEESQNCIVPSQ